MSDSSYTYNNRNESVSDQADTWATITPSDATVLNPLPKAVRCDGAGVVALKGRDNVVVNFTVAAGETLPLRPKSVMATGTTATGIVALY